MDNLIVSTVNKNIIGAARVLLYVYVCVWGGGGGGGGGDARGKVRLILGM